MKCPTIVFTSLLMCFLATSLYGQDTTATQPAKTGQEKVQYGIASWYSDKFHGRKTANGEIFDQGKMTAAHNKLPFGTWLKVTNLRNKKWVYVRVTDRLHYRNKRVVDLTRAAASSLGMLKSGIVRVKVEVLGKKKPTE